MRDTFIFWLLSSHLNGAAATSIHLGAICHISFESILFRLIAFGFVFVFLFDHFFGSGTHEIHSPCNSRWQMARDTSSHDCDHFHIVVGKYLNGHPPLGEEEKKNISNDQFWEIEGGNDRFFFPTRFT